MKLLQKYYKGEKASYKTDIKALYDGDNPVSLESRTLDIHNSDMMMVHGSSLTQGSATMSGYGWVEKLNDIVDIPIINQGKGATNLLYNVSVMSNNISLNMASDVKPRDLNITHVLWNNNANGTNKGSAGFAEMELARYITEQYGAKMLIGCEEPVWSEVANTWTSFAKSHNIPYMNVCGIIGKCYPSAMYAGLIYRDHRNWRGVAPYQCYRDMIDSIRVRKSIKMFKVRPQFTVSEVNDLAYDNNEQRLLRFYGISAGVMPQTWGSVWTDHDFTQADNMDNAAYDLDVSDTIENPDSSDVAKLLSGSAISFSDYALIECILDVCTIDDFTFSVTSSANPSGVYVAVNPSSLSVNTVNSTFESVPFSYSGGTVSFSLEDRVNVLNGDKVKILIMCDGSFSLSNPKAVYSGQDKILQEILPYEQRKTGTELRSETGIVSSDWTLTGSAEVVDSYPDGIRQVTSYNSLQSFLALKTNSDTAVTTVQHQTGSKVAIRIAAQNFHKWMTTRFASDTSGDYDDYVSDDAVVLGEHEYDYGGLRLTINDSFVKDFIVQSGWSELYAEFDTQYEGDLVIKLERVNVDSSTTPIHIHDLSVQEL